MDTFHLSPPAGRGWADKAGVSWAHRLSPGGGAPLRSPCRPQAVQGQGQQGPAARSPAPTAHRASLPPGGSPPAGRAPQETSAQDPADTTRPDLPRGRGGVPALQPPGPSSPRAAPSHGHLGPPGHGVGARLRRGAGLLAEEPSPHLPLGTQEPATATPETRGSTRVLKLTPGTSDLSCSEATRVTPGPAQHPGYCRHPPPATPGMKGGSQCTGQGQRQLRWAHPGDKPSPAGLGEAGRPLHTSNQEEA